MGTRALTYRFASWAAGLRTSGIPKNVMAVAQLAMLDTLGVMVAGGAHADIRKLAAIWSGADGTCGLVTGGVATAERAALINGAAAHFWDFDDTSYTGIMHGSAVVFPTVLALAQETGASEDDARTAFIIGSEIAYVLADISTQEHYFHGWWSTMTFGLVGATAAAARLLGCNTDQMAQAIGLAAAAAGGGKSVFGTQAKPYLAGETAQRAIGFARFVASGLTGPREGIEGGTGFLHLLNNDVENLAEADSIGKRWRLVDPGLLFKLNPVCSAAHAAIEEIARLTFHSGVAAGDIDNIRIEVPKLVRISLIHDFPKFPAEAQFSLPFAAACAVLNGAVRLDDLDIGFINAVDTKALMAHVEIIKADDLSTKEARKQFPESARVTIRLRDRTKRSGFCGEAYGMPGRPLSDADFKAKFHSCLSYADRTISSPGILQAGIVSLARALFVQPASIHPLKIHATGGTSRRE